MLDALAAGEAALTGVVAAHTRECVTCQSYYESQATLFRGIEESLKVIANEAVPRSLVPGVRARLKQDLPARSPWLPAWGMAAIAAAILVMSFGLLVYRPPYQGVLRENEPVALQQVEDSFPVLQPAKETPSGDHQGRQGRRTPATVVKVPEAAPEVIVLPEERAAFARFVADVPEQGVVLALTRVAPSNEDMPLQIAVLEIHELEVQSLDPSWE